jgi:drug/metabolite transporter (DMT)-like permease
MWRLRLPASQLMNDISFRIAGAGQRRLPKRIRDVKFSAMTPNAALRPYLLLTLTALFWSGNFVLGRSIREMIPPISLGFWRWAGAFLILAPFGLPRVRRQWDLVRRHWKLLALLSIPSISVFNTFVYTALQTTTTTNAALVNAMTPILIVVMARLMFGTRLGFGQAAGVLISLTGLLFIITHGDWGVLARLSLSRGDLLTLAAALAWAIYSVLLRLKPIQMDPLTFLTVMVAFGTVFLLPFYLWERSAVGGFDISLPGISAIIYTSVFPSVLAYIFWNHGVDRVGPGRAGLFIHLMPVFSILLAALLLGERVRLYHGAGMLLIFCGIVLNSRPVPAGARAAER